MLRKRGVGVGATVVELFIHVVEMHLVVSRDVLTILIIGVAWGECYAVLYATVHTVISILQVKCVGEKHIVGVVALTVKKAVLGIEVHAIEPGNAVVGCYRYVFVARWG